MPRAVYQETADQGTSATDSAVSSGKIAAQAICEAAAQRRPAKTERKNRVFSTKRQAVWFETQSISN